MVLYSANPTSDPEVWFVWDIYAPALPMPIFFGTMEDAGIVADALNNRVRAGQRQHRERGMG